MVAPENQLAVVQDYLKKHGTGSRQAFVELLHIAPHQATNILKHMVERGELIRIGKRYRLPGADENAKT